MTMARQERAASVDTKAMSDDACVSRFPAEAVTEVGQADDDPPPTTPEGFAIAVLLVVSAIFAALALAHFVA